MLALSPRLSWRWTEETRSRSGEKLFSRRSSSAVRRGARGDIKIERRPVRRVSIDEGTEITGIAHLAGGVLNADCDASVMCMEDEVLQGAEGGIAFAWIGYFARTPMCSTSLAWADRRRRRWRASVVHGLDAADALDFAD